jgi:hypothetical protein
MSLLDPPRCPNCNSEVALKELWDAAPKSQGGSLIVRPVGLACPTCGVKLKVLQRRLLLCLAVSYIVPFAIVVPAVFMAQWDNDRERRLVSLGLLMIAYFGAFRILQRLIPRLLRVRLLKDNEKVVFPLAKAAVETAESQETGVLSLEPTGEDRPEWTCKSCGEENPGNFDECWKCQEPRGTEEKQ